MTLLNRFNYLVDIVGDLRNQDDIRAARHAGVQRQEANLVPHHLHDKYPAMRSRRGMDVVDRCRGNIHRALEAECHVRSPEIIVDGLGQRNHVESFFLQQIRRLMRSISAQNHKAVQLQLVIILLHRLDLVQSVLIRIPHLLKRHSAAAQDRAAFGQDT